MRAQPAIEVLRRKVLQQCEAELAELCRREADIEPEHFLADLRGLRRERQVDDQLAHLDREAELAMREISSGVERAKRALELLPESGRGALARDLARIIPLIESATTFGPRRFEHRVANDVHDDQDRDHHRLSVVSEFANERFLGLKRSPTMRELALLSLLFDPEAGCSQRRYESTKPIRTAAQVIKAEVDAIRNVVKRDPIFCRLSMRDT